MTPTIGCGFLMTSAFFTGKALPESNQQSRMTGLQFETIRELVAGPFFQMRNQNSAKLNSLAEWLQFGPRAGWKLLYEVRGDHLLTKLFRNENFRSFYRTTFVNSGKATLFPFSWKQECAF